MPVRWLTLATTILFVPLLTSDSPRRFRPSPIPLAADPRVPGKRLPAEVTRALKNAVVPFVANAGQVNESVQFYAQTFGGSVFITTDGEVVYSLGAGADRPPLALTERLLHARPSSVRGLDRAITTVSYLVGHQADWRTGLATYNSLTLGFPYEAIEFRLSAHGNTVEKLFHVGPGGRVGDIHLAIDGASQLTVKLDGRLEAMTSRGAVTFSRPIAFQEIDGARRDVDVAYDLRAEGYGFVVGDYDRSVPLVIDPTLASTFIGGSGTEGVYGLRFAADGDVYVAGTTTSTNFPVATSPHGGSNVFVARLDADLTAIEVAAYVGGAALEEFGGLALDASGSVFVSGSTTSNDLPVTPNVSYDWTREPGGLEGTDLFVAKLDPNLTGVMAATYLGGSGDDFWCCGSQLHVDHNGNVFTVTLSAGASSANNYPVTAGAYDTTYNDVNTDDIVISKLSNNLSTLVASTFLGGGLWDVPYNSVLDPAGNIYVVGRTSSGNNVHNGTRPVFPTTAGAYHGDYSDTHPYFDGFVSKLNNDLTTLMASTYLGTASLDIIWDVAVAADGSIYVAGSTPSNVFPRVAGGFDASFGGLDDGFISHLSSDLTQLYQSTYLGGAGVDNALGIAIDALGDVHVGGLTNSSAFPTTAGAFQTVFHSASCGGGVTPAFTCYDGTYSVFNSALTTLKYSTFVGGNNSAITGASNTEAVYRPRLHPQGGAYLHGGTSSSTFPTSTPTADNSYAGNGDGFVLRVPTIDLAITLNVSADSVVVGQSLTYTVTVTNNGPGSAANVIIADRLPDGMTYVLATPSQGTCAGTIDISCNVGTLAQAGIATVDIAVTADQAGLITNTASIGIFDPVTVNNTATKTVTVLEDADQDGVPDESDNCSSTSNPDQVDTDGDDIGDACDADPNDGPLGDADGDAVANDLDNCRFASNPTQTDTDGDGQGDACDADDDGDTVADAIDNCPLAANADQLDTDGDLGGNVCDADDDGDGISDSDELAGGSNPLNAASTPEVCDGLDNDLDGTPDDGLPNVDGDAFGDGCDSNNNDGPFGDLDGDGTRNADDPDDADGPLGDLDGDGDLNGVDNCPMAANPAQDDVDQDGLGDACDTNNNDGPAGDLDGDGIGNAADPNDTDGPLGDLDSDGRLNNADNCPTAANTAQIDADQDGLGDACDPNNNDGPAGDLDGDGVSNADDPNDNDGPLGDLDADGVLNGPDNCDTTANADQADADGDAIGDACDAPASMLFGGLMEPYAPPPASFKLGRTIPLKWNYTTAEGVTISSPGANPMVYYGSIPCNSTSGDAPREVDAPANSGYHYDPVTYTWGINWQTKGLAAGCYVLVITSPQAQSSLMMPIQLK